MVSYLALPHSMEDTVMISYLAPPDMGDAWSLTYPHPQKVDPEHV